MSSSMVSVLFLAAIIVGGLALFVAFSSVPQPSTASPTTLLTLAEPTSFPTQLPISRPPVTRDPTLSPTEVPSLRTTQQPTQSPMSPIPVTEQPTQVPTSFSAIVPVEPMASPTQLPTSTPTQSPTKIPTPLPTSTPTQSPTKIPTQLPTQYPTQFPTPFPTLLPTEFPTQFPTRLPTAFPTKAPTPLPTKFPTTPVPTSLSPVTTAPTRLPPVADTPVITNENAVAVALLEDVVLNIPYYHCAAPNAQSHVILLHGAAFTKEHWKDSGVLDLLCVSDVAATALDLAVWAKHDELRDVLDALAVRTTTPTIALPVDGLVSPSASGGTVLDWIFADSTELQTRIARWIPVAAGSVLSRSVEQLAAEISDWPILAIYGDRDSSGKRSSERLKEAAPDTIVVELPGGHPVYLDSPTEFSASVIQTLSSDRQRRRRSIL